MKKFVTLSLTMIVAAILLLLIVTPPAVASDLTYSFELTGPQTATNGSQTIRLTGSGSFDPAAGTVVASGSFTVANNSTGAVVSKGTWNAMTVADFTTIVSGHTLFHLND